MLPLRQLWRVTRVFITEVDRFLERRLGPLFLLINGRSLNRHTTKFWFDSRLSDRYDEI